MTDTPRRVFISYSHDSAEHRVDVLALANRLRTDGLDCQIDQYVNGFPPEGWQRWMETQIETADFVLVVCTPVYLKRYRGQDRDGGRGVSFEGVVISQTLYDTYYENAKFVPVLPDAGDLESVPLPLKGFSAFQMGADYEGLYRYLTGQAAVVMPEVGEQKVLASGESHTLNVHSPTPMISANEASSPGWKSNIFSSSNLLFAGGLLLSLGGLAYAALSLFDSLPGDEPVTLKNKLVLQPIPAGSFEMGGQLDHVEEKPVHTVKFARPFWMSATEITFAQYDAYAQAQQLNLPNDEGWGRGQRPVINVSWHDAKAYTNWLSRHNAKGLNCRLPSEAEWEYAARAGSRMLYSWGERVGKNNAHCLGCGSEWDGKNRSAPVAALNKPNHFGLHDMHGNVAEWVADSWHADYNGAPRDGSVWQSGGNEARRVIRGGSWGDGPDAIRSAHRGRTEPDSKNNYV
ncbi:MAG: SUMF1/EgtB/PvdO family nonheme iron enzyme, partial [Thiolinea sp.]